MDKLSEACLDSKKPSKFGFKFERIQIRMLCWSYKTEVKLGFLGVDSDLIKESVLAI